MADADFLLTAAGRELLAFAAALDGPLLSRAAVLRRRADAAQVHAVLECIELRRRGRVKFDRADEMYFTPAGLEMASSQRVAVHKAARFAGSTRIADLCCGIGGDSIGLAGVAPVMGVDLSPTHIEYARENLRVYGFGDRCGFHCGDASEVVVGADAVHIDPDWREASGRRNSNPHHYRPDLPTLSGLAARYGDAAIKIGSAADFDRLGWDCEIELISDTGECKQAVCWFGRFRRGRRTATLLPSGRTLVDFPCGPAPLRPVGRFLYEPDPAVIRAGLIDQLAAEAGLAVLDRRIAYLTGETAIRDSALAGFAVRDVMPWNFKRVREHIRRAGIGRLEVKKRGVECDPNELARTLPGGGDEAATLILTRIGDDHIAVVASRLPTL